MATVFLTTSAKFRPHNDWDMGGYIQLKASAEYCSQHALVDDPETADIILFAELGTTSGPFDEFIRYHPLYQKYPSKVYICMNRDYPFHAIPGLYTGLEKNLHFPWAQAGFYIIQTQNPFLNDLVWNETAPYLFSFVGAVRNHPVRQKLRLLSDTQGLFQDTGRLYLEAASQNEQDALSKLHKNFADSFTKSKFILCPRGFTSSSVRIFEVMQAGRVPVIISNDWVAPRGLDWPSFSLHLRENHIEAIPEILRSKEKDARSMGEQARLAWQTYYAEDKLFATLVDNCLAIQQQEKRWLYKASEHLKWAQLLRPKLAKIYIKSRWRLFRDYGKWYF